MNGMAEMLQLLQISIFPQGKKRFYFLADYGTIFRKKIVSRAIASADRGIPYEKNIEKYPAYPGVSDFQHFHSPPGIFALFCIRGQEAVRRVEYRP